MGMAKCKDCLHYEACLTFSKIINAARDVKKGCEHFKDRTEVAEVVRCKDCKHCLRHTVPLGTYGYCNHFGYYDYAPEVQPEDFCSYGERREGDVE